jgi:hypothetical protein
VAARIESLLPADCLELVKKHGGFVAGSAVLSALVESTWEPRNLDIYFSDQVQWMGGLFSHPVHRETVAAQSWSAQARLFTGFSRGSQSTRPVASATSSRKRRDVLPAVELRSRGSLIGIFVKFGEDPVRELVTALDHWLKSERLQGFRLAHDLEDILDGKFNDPWRGLFYRLVIFEILSDLVVLDVSANMAEFDSIMFRKLELE